MDIHFDENAVLLRLSREEAERLGVAIAAGWDTASRPEYFIRTGLSQPVVRRIADALTSESPSSTSIALPLGPGIEEVENPRRRRGRDDEGESDQQSAG